MKTIKNVSIAVVAAMTFAACSSEGFENDGLTANSTTIQFDGYLGRSAVGTRGAVSNLDGLKGNSAGFAVFGQYSSESSKTTFESNLFNNVQVTWGESAWTYSPLRYWPTEGSIDFYAVAPYSASKTLGEISDTDKDKLKLDYTVSSNIADQVDLLYAKVTGKTKANNGSAKVQLTFNHALSKIGYSVKTKDNYSDATINVTSIKLVGSVDGNTTAFYTGGSLNLKNGSWSNTSSKQNFTWLSTSTTITSTAINNGDSDFLFVIPQEFSSSESLYVVVEYTVQTTGTTAVLKNKVSQKLTKNFEQGKAYNINLSVGLTPIEFEASVSEWTSAEDVSVTW